MSQGITYVDSATGDLKYQGPSGSATTLAKGDGTITTIGLRSGSGNPNYVPDFVQGISSSGLTATTPGSVTAGNLLVVCIQTEGAGITSATVSDSMGTSYTLAETSSAVSVRARVYYGVAPSSGVCIVTGNQNASFARTSVGEFKNISSTLDDVQFTSGATVNVTVSAISSLIIGIGCAFHSSWSATPGSGYTEDIDTGGSDATYYEHKSSNLTGSIAVDLTPTASDNQPWFGLVFHPSGSLPSTIGSDGDFYIDTVGRIIYGPRASGVYPRIGSFNA